MRPPNYVVSHMNCCIERCKLIRTYMSIYIIYSIYMHNVAYMTNYICDAITAYAVICHVISWKTIPKTD